jgi:hypothetical protein
MAEDCALGCGQPLNPHDSGVWKQVVGWVGGPRKDSMVLRSDTGKYAHGTCIDKARAGQSVDQPDIFDEDAQQEQPEASPQQPQWLQA